MDDFTNNFINKELDELLKNAPATLLIKRINLITTDEAKRCRLLLAALLLRLEKTDE